MKRKTSGWFAHPLLSALIAAVWLALHGSLAASQLLAGSLMGLVIPRIAKAFLGAGTTLRRPALIVGYASMVLADVVRANVVVAWIVLNPASRPQPAWVRVPLALRHPSAIALLATVVTTTPGTVSCLIDETRGELLVHALDCADAEALAAQIKARYEAPLLEIFG